MSRIPSVLALFALLSGCAVYQTVEPGMVSVGRLQLETASEWTRINPEYLHEDAPRGVWTRDGVALNRLLLYDGIEDGGTLFFEQDSSLDPYPAYRATMSESEIAELVADSMKRVNGANSVVLDRLAPAQLAGQAGIAGELSFTAKSELDYRSYFAAAVIGGKLCLIVYSAPRLYFYDRDLVQVQRMVSSARVGA